MFRYGRASILVLGGLLFGPLTAMNAQKDDLTVLLLQKLHLTRRQRKSQSGPSCTPS